MPNNFTKTFIHGGNMENIQISAKVLGQVAMPDFCPRCFYIKLHTKKLPWQLFPGIFSTIDAYTKKIVHAWIDMKAKGSPHFPDFLKDFRVQSYEKAPHWSKFKMETPQGITLTGGMDDLWGVPGGFVIPDYKTAKFTQNADKLLPMYRTQLNGYAKIAEATGIAPVKSIVLIYFEPKTDEGYVATNHHPTHFNMTFKPHVLSLALDVESVDPLLTRAREIYDGGDPEPTPGCKDCDALSFIVGNVLGY